MFDGDQNRVINMFMLNFTELYTSVMKFANNASSTGAGPTQKANAVKEAGQETPENNEIEGDEFDYSGINAFNGRRYICNQLGHTQWECRKGAGKGEEVSNHCSGETVKKTGFR